MKKFLAALMLVPIFAFAGNGAGTMSFTMNPDEETDQIDDNLSGQYVRFVGVNDNSIVFDLATKNNGAIQLIRMSHNIDKINEYSIAPALEKSSATKQWEAVPVSN